MPTEKDIELYASLLGYAPSAQQTAIFNFVLHESGNALIKARAGSGKTSTMITAMKLVPQTKRCLFLAFNKSIQEEISKKLEGFQNCTVKTVHSLGFSMLSRHFKLSYGQNVKVDEYKYVKRLRDVVMDYKIDGITDADKKGWFSDTVLDLLNFSRLDLAQSEKEIASCAKRHGIEVRSEECSVVKDLMKWGVENHDVLDYTDMVWMPCELGIQPYGLSFDWVFNDEAQDYAPIYMHLLKKCLARGSRLVACGDEYQCIYGFAGASESVFRSFEEFPNTSVFPLSTSYRCDKAIIRKAQTIVPDITARDGAGTGYVRYNSSLADIRDGDMVLCRDNAPLFELYTKLVDSGKACYFNGNAVNAGYFNSTLKKFKHGSLLSKSLESDGLFPRMYLDMLRYVNELVASGLSKEDAVVTSGVLGKYDKISSLMTLARNCVTIEQLEDKIGRIFAEEKKGICLSTIHKAKGLECDRVHILPNSAFHNQNRDTQEEKNISYVAITRAKHSLFFISGSELDETDGRYEDFMAEFKFIESRVKKLYGFEIKKPSVRKKKQTKTTKIVPKQAEKTQKPKKNKSLPTSGNLIAELMKH